MTLRRLKHLAATAGALNTAAMVMSGLTSDPVTFAVTYIAAVVSFACWLKVREEE